MDVAGENIPEIQINSEQNGGDQQEVSDVNISDVLEAIGIADAYNVNEMSWPHVDILEQPAPKGLRFRYECEGRSAGSIPGANSTPENKTYPTIKIHGYVGPATIIATCITKDGFFVHPHNLVGRNCNQGVCSVRVKISEDAREYQFKNLGIQCVKRRDIATALHNRQERKVDPFQMGFQHANDTSKIDLNAVRLAIQVIVKDNAGRDHSLRPVYTDIIYDKKSTSDLLIMRSSHCSGLATGGTQIIILCEKLVQATRDDTVIAFYEQDGDEEVWCKEVHPILVHKQVALVFDTPPYRDPHTPSHVTVRFQLRRRSDQERSNSLPFEYIPADLFQLKRKTPKISTIAMYEENPEMKPVVKLEPRGPSPHVGSPLHAYQPQMFAEQRWESVQANRPSPQAFGQELPRQFLYGAPGHNLSPAQHPGMSHMPPGLGHQAPMSPAEIVHMTPSMGHPSPMGGHVSPGLGHPSPMGHVSPSLGHPSPMGHVSPSLGHPSPMGHVSPGLNHPSPMGHASPMASPMGHASPGMEMSPGPMQGMGHDVQLGEMSPVYVQQHHTAYQMSATAAAGVASAAGAAGAGVAGAGAEHTPTLSEILNEGVNALSHYDLDFNIEGMDRLSTSDLLLQ